MGLLGNISLYVAFASILVTIGAGAFGARSGNRGLVRIAEQATLVTAAAVSAAVLALQIALVTLDFSLAYVGEYTSSTLSVLYRIGSMWAGQGGSLLLWGWIIALTAAWTVYKQRKSDIGITGWVYAVYGLFAALFIVMTAFLQSPFVAAEGTFTDGMGLNPLLQDPLQIIHPLALYSGYVLYTVPFAVVVGSIISGKVSGPWIRFAQVWATLSWVMLTIGMVLGARWAYAELGWGGYWAWDPVENASLIPWLTGTALLHTGLTHRGNRSRLRMPSVVLLMATFNLSLFGTFLTRSGVIQSVHAFGESNLGPVLGGAIVLSVLGCGALIVWRLPVLRYVDEGRRNYGWLGQALLSVLLVLMTIAVLWGTLYPLFARAFTGTEIAVTPGFFKVVVSPMAVAVLVLLSVSPFVKDQGIENTKREAAVRAVLFLAVFGALFILEGSDHTWIPLILALSALSVKTVLWKSRPKLAHAMKSETDVAYQVSRAAAPYFAHLGLIIMLAAITINVTGEIKDQTKIGIGETKPVAGLQVRLDNVQVLEFPDRVSFQATVTALDDEGNVEGTIVSKLERFNNSENLQAQVGILSGVTRDIYVVVDEADATTGAEWTRLTVYYNPAVNWIWFGGGILGIAGLFYVLPFQRRRRSGEPVVVDNELNALLDSAIMAARAGVVTTANERVNALLATARDLSGGNAATTEQIVAFLERNKTTAIEASGKPGVSMTRNQLIASILAIVAVVAIGAYVAGKVNGSAVPGISGTPTNNGSEASASPSSTTVDEEQVGALMQKLSADPKDAATLWNLGNIYFDATDYANAESFYNKLVVVTPDDANAWIAAGAAAFNQSNDKKAFSDWTKAVEVDPKNLEAHYNLGFWYLSQDPSDEVNAKAEWEKVVALDPKSDFAQTVMQHLDSLGK